jgi:hypothetical protein
MASRDRLGKAIAGLAANATPTRSTQVDFHQCSPNFRAGSPLSSV